MDYVASDGRRQAGVGAPPAAGGPRLQRDLPAFLTDLLALLKMRLVRGGVYRNGVREPQRRLDRRPACSIKEIAVSGGGLAWTWHYVPLNEGIGRPQRE